MSIKLKELHQFSNAWVEDDGRIECSCGWKGPLHWAVPNYFNSLEAKIDKIQHLLEEVEK